MESTSFNIVNANIISLDDIYPHPKSLTIKNGLIDSFEKLDTSLNTVDLHGATIIPGFIDSHFHLRNLGKRLDMVQLKGVDSLEKIKKLVIDECEKRNPGELILGFGWDQNLWDSKDYPDASFLNKIAPDNPVYLTRIDGHSAWVNKKAMYLSGLDIKSKNFVAIEELPKTLFSIFEEISRGYVPAMIANSKAYNNGQEIWKTNIDDEIWEQKTFPYQVKCLDWIRDEFNNLEEDDKAKVLDFLTETGCEKLLRDKE